MKPSGDPSVARVGGHVGEPASGEEAFLSAFCIGDFTGLEPILGGLRVRHLRGYTEEKLMKLVEDWCAKKGIGEERHQLVPPFLLHELSVGGRQRTLATFLTQPEHAAEPDQKRLKPQVVARDEAFVKHVLSCDIRLIVWTGDQDEDPQVKCASLPAGSCWFTTESQNLFVRACYDELWTKINQRYLAWRNKSGVEPTQRVLLLGNTGIGKTVSMNYFMLMALRAGYRVLFETRQRRFFLHDGVMDSELLEEGHLRWVHGERNVFFLVDHQQGQAPPFADAFTVAAMSPDMNTYKEFKKTRCTVLWMPMTTENELIAMNDMEFKVPVDELQYRVSTHGPNVRHAFHPDQVAVLSDLRSRISAFDYEKCLKRGVLISSDLPPEFEGMSWRILNVTTETFMVPSKVVWASRSIMQQVLAKFDQDKLHELEEIIRDGLANPARSHDVDGEFQYWSCQRLAGGLNVETFTAEYVKGQCTYVRAAELEVERHQVRLVRALPSVAEMVQHNGVVHYSKLTNEPLCDAAVVLGNELCLFQMTIGAAHNLKEQPWVAYCKAATAAGLAKVRFMFIVPFRDKFCMQRSHIQLLQKAFGIPVSLEVAEIVPGRRQ